MPKTNLTKAAVRYSPTSRVVVTKADTPASACRTFAPNTFPARSWSDREDAFDSAWLYMNEASRRNLCSYIVKIGLMDRPGPVDDAEYSTFIANLRELCKDPLMVCKDPVLTLMTSLILGFVFNYADANHHTAIPDEALLETTNSRVSVNKVSYTDFIVYGELFKPAVLENGMISPKCACGKAAELERARVTKNFTVPMSFKCASGVCQWVMTEPAVDRLETYLTELGLTTIPADITCRKHGLAVVKLDFDEEQKALKLRCTHMAVSPSGHRTYCNNSFHLNNDYQGVMGTQFLQFLSALSHVVRE